VVVTDEDAAASLLVHPYRSIAEIKGAAEWAEAIVGPSMRLERPGSVTLIFAIAGPYLFATWVQLGLVESPQAQTA
jgi:hypothetical protein